MTESPVIKSKAVVLYEGQQRSPPVRVAELAQNTDINCPPLSAWINGYSFAPAMECRMMNGNRRSSIFDSMIMGNRYVDFVGGADVISNSEVVKELLKLPFSRDKALNLVVHRVGRTLLLDKFDFGQLRQDDDSQWLRPFAEQSIHAVTTQSSTNTSPQPACPNMAIATTKRSISISELDEEFILSNFLCYSTESCLDSEATVDQPLTGNTFADLVCYDSKPVISSVYPLPDPLDQDATERNAKSSVEKASANLWTLEDMQMLVGVDMPIFGCGKHPCVSLKLKDMKKPINVLTGIDYWLDQQMCNVPELLMCYHLNGIIQNYEMIKTEDLPHLNDSRFDPELVKDVAQNILGFLRDKMTKEGHTYWLFKEEGSEVVKLYDLTSLCSNQRLMDQATNPWTLPVAILMYRVARNLQRRGAQQNRSRRTANTVYRLLNNCLDLLSRDSYPQVVGSVHYLLANLYLAYSADGLPGVPRSDNEEEAGGAGGYGDAASAWADNDMWYWQKPGSANPKSSASTISLDALTRRNRKSKKVDTASLPTPANTRQIPLPNCTNMDDCCKQALEHVYEGLECGQMYERSARPDDEEENASEFADPTQAIPMTFLPLNEQQPETLLPLAVRRPITGWQMDLTSLLLIRAATAYRMLADCSSSLGHLGRSICQARLGLKCTAAVLALGDNSVTGKRNSAVAYALEPGLLASAADALVLMARMPSSEISRCQADIESWSPYRDRMILAKAEALLTPSANFEHKSVLGGQRLPESSYELLQIAEQYYTKAISQMKLSNSRRSLCRSGIFEPTQNAISDLNSLARRRGNLKNVVGIAHIDVMKQCVTDGALSEFTHIQLGMHSSDEGECSGEEAKIERIVQGVECFETAGDTVNQALLYSNCGQLYRLHYHALTNQARKEFSQHERHLLLKAIEFYQRGLDCVQSENACAIWEMVATELASTFYTFSVGLQERPPLSASASDQVEREVVDLMQRSIGAYELLQSRLPCDDRLQVVTRTRCLDMHYRIASLCHNAMRQKDEINKRRRQYLRTNAEKHYAEAVTGYVNMVKRWPQSRTMASAMQLLRLQLERAAFGDFVNAVNANRQQPDFQLQRRNLELLTIDCKFDLAYVVANFDETALKKSKMLHDLHKLAVILLERIQLICKYIVQHCRNSNGVGTTAAQSEQWKRVYAATLVKFNVNDATTMQILSGLHRICEQLFTESRSLIVGMSC